MPSAGAKDYYAQFISKKIPFLQQKVAAEEARKKKQIDFFTKNVGLTTSFIRRREAIEQLPLLGYDAEQMMQAKIANDYDTIKTVMAVFEETTEATINSSNFSDEVANALRSEILDIKRVYYHVFGDYQRYRKIKNFNKKYGDTNTFPSTWEEKYIECAPELERFLVKLCSDTPVFTKEISQEEERNIADLLPSAIPKAPQ